MRSLEFFSHLGAFGRFPVLPEPQRIPSCRTENMILSGSKVFKTSKPKIPCKTKPGATTVCPSLTTSSERLLHSTSHAPAKKLPLLAQNIRQKFIQKLSLTRSGLSCCEEIHPLQLKTSSRAKREEILKNKTKEKGSKASGDPALHLVTHCQVAKRSR